MPEYLYPDCVLYLDCVGGGPHPKGGMAVGGIVVRGSGIVGLVGGEAGLWYSCDISCNLGPVIFLLVTALPCPF